MPERIRLHPAHRYAVDVLSGKVVANRWVRLACQRYMDDLADGHNRGLRFDVADAEHSIRFFGLLKQSIGHFAGQTLELSPWQQFCNWNIFGWKRADGARRFRTATILVGRKNGKTTMAAGLGLYCLLADDEPGAQIYSAATMRDQAKICFDEAVRMVKQSPEILEEVEITVKYLKYLDGKFMPVGADADNLDGLNAHCSIVDEVHAHKSRKMWDVLDTARGSRRQPLIIAISTAGQDRHSICFELYEYSQKVLDGVIVDDSWFAALYGLDDGDDCFDESVWIKANPNLGISKQWDYMREQASKAKSAPSRKVAFQRLDCNVWTENVSAYVPLEIWDATPVPQYETTGGACWAGLDVADTTDLTAYVELFDNTEDDALDVECLFWMPSENVARRVFDDRVPYDTWITQGYIKATPGNVLDYATVKADILARAKDHTIREIRFDRWGAVQLAQEIAEESQEIQAGGIPTVAMGQGYFSMSAPTKSLLEYILAKRLRHGGNPVLRWMAANLIVDMDAAGNVKPAKNKSREKIDGMVALVMALDAAIRGSGKVAQYVDIGL